MEDMVSVLISECWLWEEAMDMTDWARLLLAGSKEREEGSDKTWSGVLSTRDMPAAHYAFSFTLSCLKHPLVERHNKLSQTS